MPVESLPVESVPAEALTGIALDHDAVRYWSIAGPTLFNTFTLLANQRPDPVMVDAPFACAWEAHQKRGLLEALAERYDFDLLPPELTSSGATVMSPLFALLEEQLERYYPALAVDDQSRAFTRYSAALARTLRRCHEHAQTLDRDNRDDLAQLLGHRPHTVNEGMARLQEAIAEDYTEDLERRVQMLHRIEVRRDHLLRPLQQATGVGGGQLMGRLGELAGV